MSFASSLRVLCRVLLGGAVVAALSSCGSSSGPTSASTSGAVTVVGCTTVRYQGQNYEVNICRQTGNPIAFTTIANGSCALTVTCQSGCISSIPSGKCD